MLFSNILLSKPSCHHRIVSSVDSPKPGLGYCRCCSCYYCYCCTGYCYTDCCCIDQGSGSDNNPLLASSADHWKAAGSAGTDVAAVVDCPAADFDPDTDRRNKDHNWDRVPDRPVQEPGNKDSNKDNSRDNTDSHSTRHNQIQNLR